MTIINKSKNRKAVRDGIRAGSYKLRVVGTQKSGFRLGGEKDERTVVFGQTFSKQSDAVAWGEKKFGLKAVKLVLPGAKSKRSAAA